MVFSLKDVEDAKDKATVIFEQGVDVDEETGLTYDRVKCNCRYNIQYALFCRHIFAVFNWLQLKSTEKLKVVGLRWTRDYQEKVIPGLYSEHKDLNPEAFAKKFQIIEPNLLENCQELENNSESD